MPIITLPDGSTREYPAPVTGAEIAASIGAGLAKAALAMKVDGVQRDLYLPVERDAKIGVIFQAWQWIVAAIESPQSPELT